MRTTVTRDDDTAALVRKRMRERGIGFKQARRVTLVDTSVLTFAWLALFDGVEWQLPDAD